MYNRDRYINTKCPFYVVDGKLSITCEGIIDKTKTATKFGTMEEKDEFQINYCYKYPNECPIRNELEKKYK